LPHRSLQVGLSGEAVTRYVDEWTVAIADLTPAVRRVHDLVRDGDDRAAAAELPVERPYPLPPDLAVTIGATPTIRSPG
jgi:hypothetical protein